MIGDTATQTYQSKSSVNLSPQACDREVQVQPPPTSEILNFWARLREEPESDDGSTADDGGTRLRRRVQRRRTPAASRGGLHGQEPRDGQSLACLGECLQFGAGIPLRRRG